MSIFDRIQHAIFGEAHATRPGGASAPAGQPAPSAVSAKSAPSAAASSPPPPSLAATKSGQTIAIAPVLDAAVKKSGQELDWKHSIVDLTKAVGMDASLDERKELAQELGYTGGAPESAKLNIFLHKTLMKKLSENGGKVPADLLDEAVN